MKDITCFFIGHREAPESLRESLDAAVERCILEENATRFVVGQYGSFDRMAAQTVLAAKKRCPWITLFLLLPYHPAERPVETPEGFDGTLYPDGMETVPRRVAIVRANRYMVDHSAYLIAYVHHPASNSRNLLEYAQRREKKGLIRVIEI